MTLETVETIDTSDEAWMNEALLLARRAGEEEEVPVGAVIVKGWKSHRPRMEPQYWPARSICTCRNYSLA